MATLAPSTTNREPSTANRPPPADAVRLTTGAHRLLYRVAVQVQVEARALRDLEGFGAAVAGDRKPLTFSGEVLYVQEHQPQADGHDGPLAVRTLKAEFNLLGLKAGSTPLTGPISYKPRDDGSLLAAGGQLPEQWGLTWLPQIIWKAYAIRFALPLGPLAPADTWGDTVTAVVGASQATMSVHGSLDRFERVEGRPCAVTKGRFEARTRAEVSPGAELEEVDVAHVGSWETVYDIEAHRVLRQTGSTETVLMRPLGIRRESEPWISTTKVSFSTELASEDEQPPEAVEPVGQRSFARGWELLAPPFVAPDLDATPARNAFQKALQEDALVAEYHESLALALARMRGQGGRALEEMQAAVQLAPAEPRIHLELGVLLRGARRWDEAAKAFSAAAEQDVCNALPLYLEAAMLAEAGNVTAAAQRIREGNQRRACRFYLPPAAGLDDDPSRLGSALGAVAMPTVISDLQGAAAKCLREGALTPSDMAQTGRMICTAQPCASVFAMAGMEIEEQALRRPELRDDPASAQRLSQLAVLGQHLEQYRSLLPAAQVMTVGFAAPAAGYAGGPPLALPVPLFLDEQAATRAALEAAFGAQAMAAVPPAQQ